MANFDVMCVDMGQGDCTVIKCPDGKIIIIDCGSSGGLPADSFEAANETLNAWLGGGTIWALILTHPDKDHYNQFRNFLVDAHDRPLPVNLVYFSNARSDKSPLGKYSVNSVGNALISGLYGGVMLIEVTLNLETQSQKKWISLFEYEDGIEQNVDNHKLVVAQNAAGQEAWNISIIAGNVTTASRSAAEKSNASSLVVVLETQAEKTLFTGDSTHDTQDYLYDTFNGTNTISDIDLFQIPHHGSAGCASTAQFRGMINPTSLLVSVGIINDSHRLPRYSVLNSWLGGARINTDDEDTFTIDYWKTPAEGGINNREQINAQIAQWRTDGHTVLNNDARTFFWLEDPDDADDDSYYGITFRGFTIYRVEENKEIYETGVNGTLFFTV